MYCKRFRLWAAVAVCTTLALVNTQPPVAAEEPQTVQCTFALMFYCEPYFMDPPPELSDFVSEDTVVILLRDLELRGVSLDFAEWSPPCDGVPVAGSWWMCLSYHGVVVNKTVGPMGYCRVFTRDWFQPPAHAVVAGSRITEVHACWFKGSYDAFHALVAQDEWTRETAGVFVMVTAEFQVKN